VSITCNVLLIVALAAYAHADSVRKKKVLLRNGMALTFQKGETCRTYKSPDPRFAKLQCEGGNCNAVDKHVNTIQCKSEGIDDMGAMNWRCTGEIPKGCNFGSTKVSCEGFEGLDSEYIVPGSCGLLYSLNCDRIDAAQYEENTLRAKVKEERSAQQDLMYKRMAEVDGQEAADKCELAVAGALHQPGSAVEHQWRYGAEWTAGSIVEVACDGTYTFQRESGRKQSSVAESQLRTWVAPIYMEPYDRTGRGMAHRAGGRWTADDAIAERCGFPLCNGHGACRSKGPCECEDKYYGDHCLSKEMDGSEMMIALIVGLVLIGLFIAFGGQGKGSSGKIGKERVVDSSRQLDHQAMDEKRACLDKIKAAQAQVRIARVKAKQDVARQAALDKYETEMDQLQRDVTNDTAQLGNVMSRVDHVLDTVEKHGYATTEMR